MAGILGPCVGRCGGPGGGALLAGGRDVDAASLALGGFAREIKLKTNQKQHKLMLLVSDELIDDAKKTSC